MVYKSRLNKRNEIINFYDSKKMGAAIKDMKWTRTAYGIDNF